MKGGATISSHKHSEGMYKVGPFKTLMIREGMKQKHRQTKNVVCVHVGWGLEWWGWGGGSLCWWWGFAFSPLIKKTI